MIEDEFRPTTDISDITTYKLGEESKELSIISEENNSENGYDEDFEHVRKNLQSASEKVSELLDGITNLAKYSEHPRAFEVAAGVARTLTDINKDLLDIHDRKKKFKHSTSKKETNTIESQTNTQNNNILFNGTTEELEKMLLRYSGRSND